jgi:hypothetical protein
MNFISESLFTLAITPFYLNLWTKAFHQFESAKAQMKPVNITILSV